MSEDVITKAHHEAHTHAHVDQMHTAEAAPHAENENSELQKQLERIEHNLTYHAPKEGEQGRYARIREEAKEFAAVIVHMSRQSREQSLALTHLEEAVMWANAAIAREA